MKIKKNALVIISPGFPVNEADTTCITPQQIFVLALKKICPGLKIIVISLHYPYQSTGYKWHSINIIPIGGKDKGQVYRFATWVKAILILKKLNQQYKLIGLLSFWFGECALIGNYFAKRNNIKHLSWLLGQDAKPGNKYFKWIKPKGDSLIALSDFIANEVKNNYGIAIENIIPVGIDTAIFKESIPKRTIDVLGVGSLIPLKQYVVFVEAINYLKEFHTDIKAVLCGTGTEMDKLKAQVSALNLNDHVTFAGEVSHNRVLDMMQRSRILLHPSNYEGFGSVLAEGLYAGAHVVSFVKPMNKNFRQHHVVGNHAEMNNELLFILNDKHCQHDQVLMYPDWYVAKLMINLFID